MTRYRISQGGEPVAIVTSLDLARGIARGQPPGYYSVDELQVGPPVAAGQAAVRRRASAIATVANPAPNRVGRSSSSSASVPLMGEAGGESVWRLGDNIILIAPG